MKAMISRPTHLCFRVPLTLLIPIYLKLFFSCQFFLSSWREYVGVGPLYYYWETNGSNLQGLSIHFSVSKQKSKVSIKEEDQEPYSYILWRQVVTVNISRFRGNFSIYSMGLHNFCYLCFLQCMLLTQTVTNFHKIFYF